MGLERLLLSGATAVVGILQPLLFTRSKTKYRVFILWEFTTFASTIIHLVYPPKFCIGIAFKFSLGDGKSLEKLDTMLRQNLWGVKVYYGNVKVGNKHSSGYTSIISLLVTVSGFFLNNHRSVGSKFFKKNNFKWTWNNFNLTSNSHGLPIQIN